ncbi:MAG: hypothetical protein OK436_07460 [Thaumarchaeota archaeon]|nr:hypothetical protein [Nitrososphaerota archaeon]
MSNREPRERKPRPRTPPTFVLVKIRADTYELLSKAQAHLSERRNNTVNLSEAIDELIAVSPFLLKVIAPEEATWGLAGGNL